MRLNRCFFACPMVIAMLAMVASAQTYSLSDNAPIKPVVFAESNCDAGCDAAPDCGCDATPDCGCDSAAGDCCDRCLDLGLRCCDLGEPFTLFGTSCCTGVEVGGWVQAGYTDYNTGMFNNHPGSLDVNQVWLYAEKTLDNCGCGWDWGFRFDYVYGTDGPDTQAFGNNANRWDEGWDNGGFYGSAIPQLYLEVGYNNLSVKLGHFFTLVGYEVVPATGNFFYSHAFTMYNSEPFTHTGALATYTLCNDVEIYAGWTAGWDTGFDRNKGDSFLGGFSTQLTDDIGFTYIVTAGQRGNGVVNDNGYSHSMVVDVVLTDRMNYVFQHDLLSYNTLETTGVNQYLFYELSDCFALGGRFEWWQVKETSGDRDLYEFTVGVNYRPHANMVIRPELRWDEDNTGFIVPAAHNDRVGFGIDAIVTF